MTARATCCSSRTTRAAAGWDRRRWACFVQYSPANNTLYLHNDADNSEVWATLGTAGALSNSQCSIDTGASSASGSGNNLTLTLAITFRPGLNGSQNVYMAAVNKSN